MSVNASWLRMFIEMRKRHTLEGKPLALGVQDVMFTHETAEALLNERAVDCASIPVVNRRYHLSRNQKQFTSNPNHYMCVKDLFFMMGFDSLDTLDAFNNDEPDIEWDLCQPIPKEMHNRYDLLFDIGVLEHTSDIFQALENVGNLVKPGGWIILYLPMVSPINSSMYHPNPPFYFDILSGNGFGDFDGWINWMPDWDQQNDIRTIWLNYQYNDDVYIWRPRYFTVMWFMARKLKHVGEFRPVLQNFYKEWHAGMELFGTSQEELTRTGKLITG
jgi:SAM-dependent methyltransferase